MFQCTDLRQSISSILPRTATATNTASLHANLQEASSTSLLNDESSTLQMIMPSMENDNDTIITRSFSDNHTLSSNSSNISTVLSSSHIRILIAKDFTPV
jgi:hypothetical protein